MKFDEERSELVFSSGRREYCHNGMLGLDINQEGATYVGYGSDGSILLDDLTFDEKLELADELVARASRFRLAVLEGRSER